MRTGIRWLPLLTLAFALAACDDDSVEDEVQDVIEEHQDVVEQQELTPNDTSLIAEQVRQRDREQEEAAQATREAVRDLRDTLQDTTRRR